MRRRTFLGFTLGGLVAPFVMPSVPERIPLVYLGTVDIGAIQEEATSTTLADVVAALQQSLNRGTLSDDFGSRIGYLDAESLTRLRVVPSTYDGLAHVIGYGDLDALLHEGV